MIVLERRGAPSFAMQVAAPVLAVALSVLTGFALFAAVSDAPVQALYNFFIAPVSSAFGVGELFLKATPLALIATGLALGFRANVWNIGAEGQLVMGAVAGGAVALAFHGSGGFYVLPLMLLAGVAAGLAWAAIAAFLKTRFNASELLASLLLVYIASLFLNYLVHGPLKDPDGFAFPESRLFGPEATMPLLWAGTRLHVGALLAPLVAIAAWFLLSRTVAGYSLRVVGEAPAAARFAGIQRERIVWLTLLTGGGLAGLAGTMEVAGPIGQLVPIVSPGYGFTAIIVAFLGRLHPLGILLASLVVALSYLGGEMIQIASNLPLAVAGVFQGLLLFYLLALDVLVGHRPRWVRLRRPTREAQQLARMKAVHLQDAAASGTTTREAERTDPLFMPSSPRREQA